MAQILDDGTIPNGLRVKTSCPPMMDPFHVAIGDGFVDMRSLLNAAFDIILRGLPSKKPGIYVVHDPFFEFVQRAQKLQEVDGFTTLYGRDDRLKRLALCGEDAAYGAFGALATLDAINIIGPHVKIGDYMISRIDFVRMLWYVLTNTDMPPDDPRRAFIARLRRVHFEDLGHVDNSSLGVSQHLVRLIEIAIVD